MVLFSSTNPAPFFTTTTTITLLFSLMLQSYPIFLCCFLYLWFLVSSFLFLPFSLSVACFIFIDVAIAIILNIVFIVVRLCCWHRRYDLFIMYVIFSQQFTGCSYYWPHCHHHHYRLSLCMVQQFKTLPGSFHFICCSSFHFMYCSSFFLLFFSLLSPNRSLLCYSTSLILLYKASGAFMSSF